MQLKITIELPDKLGKALELFCEGYHAKHTPVELFPAEKIQEMSEAGKRGTRVGKEIAAISDMKTPKTIPSRPNQPETEAPVQASIPDNEQFAKLPLSEMEVFMKDPKNLTPFRFRAFAACAREVYGKPVEKLSRELNEKGINGILKTKDKATAALFIARVINKEFLNDLEF